MQRNFTHDTPKMGKINASNWISSPNWDYKFVLGSCCGWLFTFRFPTSSGMAVRPMQVNPPMYSIIHLQYISCWIWPSQYIYIGGKYIIHRACVQCIIGGHCKTTSPATQHVYHCLSIDVRSFLALDTPYPLVIEHNYWTLPFISI